MMDFSIIACYIFGVLFAFFGIASLIRQLHDRKVCVHEAIAHVVDYEIQKDSGGKNGIVHNHYFPICSFYAEGKEIRKASPTGYDNEAYPIGSGITILYEDGNPENFIEPGNHASSYGVSIIIALMGLGLLVVTVLRQMGIIVV